MTTIDIEVKGLLELQAKMEQMVADLHGAPVLNAMRDSALMVERDAKINAPVDTGRLRASIVPEIVAGADQIWGIVGSNVEYAPYQEFGTGIYAMYPTSRSWKTGGVRPKLYLTRAFQKNEDNIRRRFEHTVEIIVNK
jgi:HK97 gp10 family phage protein